MIVKVYFNVSIIHCSRFACFFFAEFLVVLFFAKAFRPAAGFHAFAAFLFVTDFFEDFLAAFFAAAFFAGTFLLAALVFTTTGIISADGIKGSAKPSPAAGRKTTSSPGFGGSGSNAFFAASDALVAMSFTVSIVFSIIDLSCSSSPMVPSIGHR